MSDPNRYDIAVIGGGSAAEALLRELSRSDKRTVIFEPDHVGGECPFFACMPSKALLHDRRSGRDWPAAVARRAEIAEGLDDSEHAATARELGGTIVRAAARLVGPNCLVADGIEYTADEIIIATGAEPVIPDIDGLHPTHDRVWTSRDALTAVEQPASVVIVGGGVIGSELAAIFAGFGTQVTTLERNDVPLGDLDPKVSQLIADSLQQAGVDQRFEATIDRVVLTTDVATVELADGSTVAGERLIVATGRRPRTSGLGIDTVGVDADELVIEPSGRIAGAANLWAMGDAAGLGQYTHVANHHAAVIADHLIGDGTRTFDEAVVPACIFLAPPVMVVGPTTSELDGDDDVVWARIDLATPRGMTDEHAPGFIAVAARRSTGCIVAANGIGASFDELVTALVVAIDGEVPVARLARMIQPFPTVGEVLGQVFAQLARELESEPVK